MLKFGANTSKLDTLINSFEDLKNISKTYSELQAKAYSNLHEWALESNNSALKDITGKLTTLYYKLDADLNQEKLNSLKNIVQIFKKFKEYDNKIEKLHLQTKSLEKLEKKYLNDLKKCQASKNIRALEKRFEKAKENKECAELKHYDYCNEIDVTKSILFKTNMKRLNSALIIQNEGEKVLLHATNALLDKIPDVSNEEVDDICEIEYKNFKLTHQICNQAKNNLNRLSSSPNIIRMERIVDNFIHPHTDQDNDQIETIPIVVNNENSIKEVISKISKLNKTRISCSPKLVEDSNGIISEKSKQIRLYPCLDKIIHEQPPTYSDSESIYTIGAKVTSTCADYKIFKDTSPSAPSYNEVSSTNLSDKNDTR